jgi:hypothetical protein
VALAAASLLIGGPSPGKVLPLGMVLHAERAYVGEAEASVGCTIFEGDRVSTDAGGALRISIPALTLQLGVQSSMVISHAAGSDGIILAELASGTLVFSAAPIGRIAVGANEAIVQPAANAATIAHVRVVNPKELRIYAQRGALEFFYHGESETIPEGKSYRVFLDPSEAELSAASGTERAQKSPTKHHVKFLFVAIAVAVAVAIPLLVRALESPDSPGPSRPGATKTP